MAESSWYLWSTFYKGGDAEIVRDRKIIHSRDTVAFGTKVTKSSLDVDDANWDALVEAGVVRKQKPPDMEEFNGSPVEYLRQQANEAGAVAGTLAAGSYFGPTEEEALADPSVILVDEDAAKEADKK